MLIPIAIFVLFELLVTFSLKQPTLRSFRDLKTVHTNKIQIATFKNAKIMALPRFIYGTAWKKDRTKELVELAVHSGFRGIDTACQPKHYYEPGVGDALQALYAEGIVTRESIFLQSKFTSLNGQDPKQIPYNKDASLTEQVHESFNKSCQNLRTHYLNCLVLHSPMSRFSDTMLVWRAMEEIYDMGGVLQLGISNTYDIQTLRKLYAEATVKPSVLQNRFYADSGYDAEIREFCKENGIMYQSFWTLSANPHILKS